MTAKYDTIDQWLDWGDHTVMVDPIGNSAWIHEGQEGKHQMTRDRGREYDAADTRHLMRMLAQPAQPQGTSFLPSTAELEKLPKFPSRRSNGCDVWRGELRDIRGTGELPIIAQHIRDGLPEAQKGVIERQLYSNQHRIATKVFSRAGVPDHGLPSNGNPP